MAIFDRISIKLRLTVGASFSIGILLFGLGLIAHKANTENELNKIDTFLTADARGVANSLSSVLGNTDSKLKAISGLDWTDYGTYFVKYLKNRADTPAGYKTSLAYLDTKGQRVFQSNESISVVEDYKDDLKIDIRVIDGGGEISTITASTPIFRLISLPLTIDSKFIGTIRIGTLLDVMLENADGYDRGLFILFAFIFIGAIVGSYSLITFTLRTVIQMAKVAGGIDETNLSVRIPETPGRDEISRLSIAFNRLLDRLSKAYSFQKNLVNDLSHQLRTPLAILRANTEVAMNHENIPAQLKGDFEDMIADIDRMSSLLLTILELARLESGTVETKKEDINLVELLYNMFIEMKPLWQHSNFHFTFKIFTGTELLALDLENENFSIDSSLEFAGRNVPVDVVLIKQVFINVLSNAFKHCPEKGIISVILDDIIFDSKPFVRIVFTNSGPPIPEGLENRIFDRFYSSSHVDIFFSSGQQSNKENLYKRGFGLGLSFAKSIVQMHHGHIRAFNPQKGGAAFEVLIPC